MLLPKEMTLKQSRHLTCESVAEKKGKCNGFLLAGDSEEIIGGRI